MSELPSWTSYAKGVESHRGLYPLGLEPLGASISRLLLPGITNVAVHVRYFSFLSWVFWTFKQYHERNPRLKLDRRAQKRWRIRLENVHRTATLLMNPQITGLVGVERARRLDDGERDGTVDVTNDKPATPFQAAFYSASFANLGCGAVQGNAVALTTLGVRLAEAFDAELRSIRGGDAALDPILRDTPRVPVGAIRSLAPALTLRSVPPGSREHEALIEMLFRFGRPETGSDISVMDGRRARCLGLLLDLARQANGRLSSPYDLHSVFASGRFSDRGEVELDPAFRQEFAFWQRFQERQWQKLGIHAAWEEVVDFLRTSVAPVGGPAIHAHLAARAEQSAVLRLWCGTESLSATVAEASARAARRAYGLARSQLSPIETLVAELTGGEGSEEQLGLSLVILLLVVSHWRKVRDEISVEQRRFHRAVDGPGRLPLDWLVEQTGQLRDATMRDYLHWIVERCVVDQASRVALQKLAAGQFRFFLLRDSDGFRIVKDRGHGKSLTIDSRRFPAAYQLLEGLELVSLDNTVAITPAGRLVLRRLIGRFSPSSVVKGS